MTAMIRPDDLTITEIGRRYRSGEADAAAVMSQLRDRITETDPTIHAFVEVFGETARAEAAAADAALASGDDRGPLHGIPIGVKDIIDMAGIQTRCGSRGRDDIAPAASDALVVRRLRDAGAVFIGKTITQEYAAGVVSAPARNPWDAARIPGGSSGGSAASVAVGSCVAALGTDTGGSIRIPASVTGTVGLKPTYGAIPCTGIFPLAWSLDTVGPITRTVRDAEIVFNALLGEPTRMLGGGVSANDLTGLRIGVPRPYFFERLQPGVRSAVETAILTMRDLGAVIIDVEWAEAAAARALSVIISRAEASEVHAAGYLANPAGFGPDIRSRLAVADALPARDYVLALRARAAIKRSVAELYAEHRLDALVTPTLCATAALADNLTVDLPDGTVPVFLAYTMLTMPFNATGQPCLSIPCGFDELGLPVGLQIVGQPYQEADLCRIGHVYEQAAGWHRFHPPI